jgi:hypothetical protein
VTECSILAMLPTEMSTEKCAVALKEVKDRGGSKET